MNGGFFQAFYQSELQHPILLWGANIAGTLLAVVSLRRKKEDHRSILNFILFWALVSFFDAWLSANHVYGLGALPDPASSVIPFIFVWAGDFRIFLAMEERKPALRAVGACFVVPILAGVLTLGKEPRILFLVYECLFLIWIVTYGKLTASDQSPRSRRVRNFALLFYSLWVFSDALILALPSPWNDIGFAIRVIPNVLYYGAFGWVCARAWSHRP